jgi:hypothetical protein
MFIWHNGLSLHSATYLLSFPSTGLRGQLHITVLVLEMWLCSNIKQKMHKKHLCSKADVKGKGKAHPKKGNEGPEVEQVYSSTLSLTSVLDGAGWSMPCPSHFTPRKDPVPTV